MPYENSGTPASLISHALNEILALGIPRYMYTYGQLVATAFFCILGKEIQSSTVKRRICTNVPSKTQQDAIIRFQQLSPHSLVAIPMRVDGSHGHCSIIYIRILGIKSSSFMQAIRDGYSIRTVPSICTLSKFWLCYRPNTWMVYVCLSVQLLVVCFNLID